MIRTMILIAVLTLPATYCQAQTAKVADEGFKISEVESKDSFHRELIRAASRMRAKGELSRGQVIKLRVAMLSPAFRQRAKELAVTQMVFSGSDEPIPVSDDGTIDETQIDWDKFADFLERLLPIVLQLLTIFGAI